MSHPPTNTLVSTNPYDGRRVGEVALTCPEELPAIERRALHAFPLWKRRPFEERAELLQNYARQLLEESETLARLITCETGKPLWESRTEVKAMAGKIGISIEAYGDRCGAFSKGGAYTRFHPLGVIAVLGPFNFPGHLPNGHLIPALLAGNAAIFKPSEQTPLVGDYLVRSLHRAGLPPEVLQIVQGGAELGRALTTLEHLSGLFFTGSSRTGLALHKAFGGRPQTLLALEMGGNNPLLVEPVEAMQAAARIVCQSAFITAGQRCTCARRLLLPEGDWGDHFIQTLLENIAQIKVGDPLADPAPYLGTLISGEAAEQVKAFEKELLRRGGRSLLPLKAGHPSPAQLSPALVDVSAVEEPIDEECFGPLLQVCRYGSFEEGIALCRATPYGLAAGLISKSAASFERFCDEVPAGIMNWNAPLTGASSAAPFGGRGLSGNHRPSAYFAADYCAQPTASMEQETLAAPAPWPGFPLAETNDNRA
jgi:succinylglutamic semialdehyde dehydrogenase